MQDHKIIGDLTFVKGQAAKQDPSVLLKIRLYCWTRFHEERIALVSITSSSDFLSLFLLYLPKDFVVCLSKFQHDFTNISVLADCRWQLW